MLRAQYAEEFDWACGYPNGFFNLVGGGYPAPFSATSSSAVASMVSGSDKNQPIPGNTEKEIYSSSGSGSDSGLQSGSTFYTQATDANGGFSSTLSYVKAQNRVVAGGATALERRAAVNVSVNADWGVTENGATAGVSSGMAYLQEKRATTTTTTEARPLVWSSYTESREGYVWTTTNGSITYGIKTTQTTSKVVSSTNSTMVVSTTSTATSTGLKESFTSTTYQTTRWNFSASSTNVTTTRSGICTIGTYGEAFSWSYSSSYKNTRSSSVGESYPYTAPGEGESGGEDDMYPDENAEPPPDISGTNTYAQSTGYSFGGSTQITTSLDSSTTGVAFLHGLGFDNLQVYKDSYVPLRATYSLGVEDRETLYYMTNSGGDWGSPQSLVGPASTTISFTYKRYNYGEVVSIAEGFVGRYHGKAEALQIVDAVSGSSLPLLTFAALSVTASLVTADYGSSGKMYDIFGKKWVNCFYTSTHIVEIESNEAPPPVLLSYRSVTSTSRSYGGFSGGAYYSPGADSNGYTTEYGGGGSGRTFAFNTFSIADVFKRHNYKYGGFLMELPDYGANVWGSAQNGYISPLTSSFHTEDPECSSWSKTNTDVPDTKRLTIGLANNFVKIEVPQLYKNSSSNSTSMPYFFSVMGTSDGSPKDSGVWQMHFLARACMAGTRTHNFSPDRMVWECPNIFNGAHSQREYVICGAYANEQKLILKEKGSSGYSNASTKFTFAHSKGETNLTTITFNSGKVYGAFVELPALSDVLGPDSPKRIVYQVVERENFNHNKNHQAKFWMNFSPAIASSDPAIVHTADWSHYIQVIRPWETSGGGGGGY